MFPHAGLQSELYDVSKAVADSKQVDVKLASFKAICLSMVSTADTSSLYVNQASPSGGELMLVPGVLNTIKEYSGMLDLGD